MTDLLLCSMFELSSFMLSAILENSIHLWLCSAAKASTLRSDSLNLDSVERRRAVRVERSLDCCLI